MPPSAGSFGLGGRNFNSKPGATVKIGQVTAARRLGRLNEWAVTKISKLNGVAAAAGALTAANVDSAFKITDVSSGGGGGPRGGGSGGAGGFRGPGSFSAGNQVTVNGVDLSTGGQPLGPLSNGTLSSGRTLKASDANSDVAVIDSGYAKSASLKVGSDLTIPNTRFPSPPTLNNPPRAPPTHT